MKKKKGTTKKTGRNYRSEYDKYQGTAKQKKRRAQRNAANRKMKKAGKIRKGDGKDVDHKDGNTANNSSSNLRVQSKSKNRSYARTKTGAKKRSTTKKTMKKKTAKRKTTAKRKSTKKKSKRFPC